jgi:hypothetical protein
MHQWFAVSCVPILYIDSGITYACIYVNKIFNFKYKKYKGVIWDWNYSSKFQILTRSNRFINLIFNLI